ncbi:MAG: CHASE2 domain-containing protein [Legionellales bacterium]
MKPLLVRVGGVIYDTMSKHNMRTPNQQARVVIIDIDDKSIDTEGRWPWPRDKFVLLLEQLKKAGVIVAALDIVMSQAEINSAQRLKDKLTTSTSPEGKQLANELIPLLEKVSTSLDSDHALANELRQNDVALGYLFHQDPLVKIGMIAAPLKNEHAQVIDASKLDVYQFKGYNGTLKVLFDAAPHSGFVSNIPDEDGIIRHGIVIAGFEHHLYSSLALSTVMHYLLADTIELKTHVVAGKNVLYGVLVGGMFVPTNEKGQMLIPYWGPPGTIDYYSATDVMKGKLSHNELADSIAIVGSTMVLLADWHPAPVANSFPGVEMNANIISGILSQNIMTQYYWNTVHGLSIIGVIGLCSSLLFLFLGPISLVIAYLLFTTSLLLSNFWLFVHHNIYVDVTIIFFIITLQATINFIASFRLEQNQKNQIKKLFGQYVPASYVKQLIEVPESCNMEGETREMTVFFTDVRDFTTISESLNANGVKQLLNTLFTPITDIIFSHQGTIDKYVGDMVVAFWGAPLNDPYHATHGIGAALTIQKKLTLINEQLRQKNLPAVSIGMGLATGLMNVGDMGSAFRRSYTVLGDTVNLGSRLESLTKFYHVDILVSEETRLNQTDFIWQRIDKVAVKGRSTAITIYEPLARRDELPTDVMNALNEYEQGLDWYYKQEWLKAKEIFDRLIEAYPSKYIYQLYSTRIIERMNQPIDPDWNGTFMHISK